MQGAQVAGWGWLGAQVIPQMLRNAITGLLQECSCPPALLRVLEMDALAFTDLCFEALTCSLAQCSVLSAQCSVLSAVRAAFSSVSVHWQAKVGGHSILCNWRSLGGQCILYTPPGRSVSILYTCRRSFYPRGDPGVNSIPWCGILY